MTRECQVRICERLGVKFPGLLGLGVFHCGAQNFDAIGGTADIDWPPAPIASEAYDPELT